MKTLSPLQLHRLSYKPALPSLLRNIKEVIPLKHASKKNEKNDSNDSALAELIPHMYSLPHLHFERGETQMKFPALKVGVILSGGQAPGGHNVIAGLLDALKKLNPASRLIGFLNGPGGLIKNQYIELTEKNIESYRNQGGFDLIGSGRTKIETPEQFEAAGNTLQKHDLDGFVIIGGDDSNTNAVFLAEYCKKNNIGTRIIGVPKTIDGDLRNAFIELPFGFDSASKIYSEIIGNLAKDSLSAMKYYFFVKLMGRSASHLTLECALQTQINLALISEEIAENKYSLFDVVQQIADLVCERAKANKHYGVILIPEGLLEFIPECQAMIKELNIYLSGQKGATGQLRDKNGEERKELLRQHLSEASMHCFDLFPEEIQKQLLLDLDPHGYIQFSKIETERLLISLVEKELSERQNKGAYAGKFSPQPLFCGYEGRSGLPTNFDCQYCYALGHLAVLLIQHGATGYICCITDLEKPVDKWGIMGVPIGSLLHFEMRKNKKQAVIQKALVDLRGAAFGKFKRVRENWRIQDAYISPGPIQFEGPPEITQNPPITLLLLRG